jgi:hypothetical protein
MFSEGVPYQFSSGETLVAEYRTEGINRGGKFGEAGILAITTRRLLFFKRKNILIKLIKKGTPSYELLYGVPLSQITHVTAKGVFEKHLVVNGKDYFMEGADPKLVVKVINDAKANFKDVEPNKMITCQYCGTKYEKKPETEKCPNCLGNLP